MQQPKITGSFAPHMVPFDDSGLLHEEELRRCVSWLVDRGTHGLYPNGSMGEFLRFTQEGRRILSSGTRRESPVEAGAAGDEPLPAR